MSNTENQTLAYLSDKSAALKLKNFERFIGTSKADATGEDRLGFFGTTVRNAVAWGGSEATWADALGGLVKVGFNKAGEMVVCVDPDNPPTYRTASAKGRPIKMRARARDGTMRVGVGCFGG